MTPDDMCFARHDLGRRWNYNRPLSFWELGCVMHLRARDPGEAYRAMETGHDVIDPKSARIIEALLDGWIPRDAGDCLDRARILEDAALARAGPGKMKAWRGGRRNE